MSSLRYIEMIWTGIFHEFVLSIKNELWFIYFKRSIQSEYGKVRTVSNVVVVVSYRPDSEHYFVNDRNWNESLGAKIETISQ